MSSRSNRSTFPVAIAWTLAQAACLFGLAACVVSGPGTDEVDAGGRNSLLRGPVEIPADCALGSSGPTLNPRNAIRQARLSAIESLAMQRLKVDVKTISVVGPDGAFEVASQALSGGLRDARIRALWASFDPDSKRENPNARRHARVFALACWPEAPAQAFEKRTYPQWLLQPPRKVGRICAVGLAGPTRNSADQAGRALRDAHAALAVALESQLELRILDVGRGVAKFAREIDPSPAAVRRAKGALRLEEEWIDERGLGPIRLPGVLYGLACIEH